MNRRLDSATLFFPPFGRSARSSIGLLALIALGLSLVFFTRPVQADADAPIPNCENLRQFTFSWQFIDQCGMKPRGGSSKGAALTLDPEPNPGWKALDNPELSNFERDRQAILAMAGPYRASFDFLEVAGYTPDFEPDRPYQSWGTEYVYVVEDEKNFISLQHIMVMYYENEKGETIGPMVQKHWRQDWRYQQKNLLVYGGHNQWRSQQFSAKDVAGGWTQSVYQVDDSPRYAAKGKWQHQHNVSTWISDETWRPLPRRESSVRSDYDVLIGTNRHTITPDGWLHEEENYKVVLDESGQPRADQPFLSKELGVNRYQRLVDFDFGAGDRYWESTKNFWRDVRQAWRDLESRGQTLAIKKEADGVPMFMPFFEYAENIAQAGSYDQEAGRTAIGKILSDYVSIAPPKNKAGN